MKRHEKKERVIADRDGTRKDYLSNTSRLTTRIHMVMCMYRIENNISFMLAKRTNILFQLDLWDQLTQLAKRMDTSVAELVRKAVQQVYFTNSRDEDIRSAVRHIMNMKGKIKGPIDYKALINEGRKY